MIKRLKYLYIKYFDKVKFSRFNQAVKLGITFEQSLKFAYNKDLYLTYRKHTCMPGFGVIGCTDDSLDDLFKNGQCHDNTVDGWYVTDLSGE